eukprot:TRINITY_DN2587_c0_g1_i1.p1 TRINITY_DN2587_c0_g1~~TRINITY_DN2587_c0_g1_i1.p1  ORF type:complete len:278 (-),score=68.35 TRINITY_DN2587_c0_g1_i1:356-1072(-)
MDEVEDPPAAMVFPFPFPSLPAPFSFSLSFSCFSFSLSPAVSPLSRMTVPWAPLVTPFVPSPRLSAMAALPFSSSAFLQLTTSHGSNALKNGYLSARPTLIAAAASAAEGQRYALPNVRYPCDFGARRLYWEQTQRTPSVACGVAVELGGSSSSGGQEQPVEVGSRIKVTSKVVVFHVPKAPKLDLEGYEGEVKDILGDWKGVPVSANLPYKVQFTISVDGADVKFFAHLKREEFSLA